MLRRDEQKPQWKREPSSRRLKPTKQKVTMGRLSDSARRTHEGLFHQTKIYCAPNLSKRWHAFCSRIISSCRGSKQSMKSGGTFCWNLLTYPTGKLSQNPNMFTLAQISDWVFSNACFCFVFSSWLNSDHKVLKGRVEGKTFRLERTVQIGIRNGLIHGPSLADC